MGEVHANHVETSLSEVVDDLDAVGLGADGADDGSSAIALVGTLSSVEVREPGDAASHGEVLEGCGRHGWDGDGGGVL